MLERFRLEMDSCAYPAPMRVFRGVVREKDTAIGQGEWESFMIFAIDGSSGKNCAMKEPGLAAVEQPGAFSL
jgi:hypothetical protein